MYSGKSQMGSGALSVANPDSLFYLLNCKKHQTARITDSPLKRNPHLKSTKIKPSQLVLIYYQMKLKACQKINSLIIIF